jgi:ferredoxin
MTSKNVLLIFKSDIMYKPVIYRLAKDFDLVFNILEAKILPRREGRILLELRGEDDLIKKGIKFLEDHRVVVEYLADKVWREEELCVHCGACTGLCPTEALSVVEPDKKTTFNVPIWGHEGRDALRSVCRRAHRLGLIPEYNKPRRQLETPGLHQEENLMVAMCHRDHREARTVPHQ